MLAGSDFAGHVILEVTTSGRANGRRTRGPARPSRCSSPARTCCADPGRTKEHRIYDAPCRSTLFTDAMALTPAGDGRYDGELNEHWTIGPEGARRRDAGAVREGGPAGARGWRMQASSRSRSPGTFCGRRIPGRCASSTTVRKRGRRVESDRRRADPGRPDGRARGGDARRARTSRPAAAVGQPGGAADAAGAAARTGADRSRPPDGRRSSTWPTAATSGRR